MSGGRSSLGAMLRKLFAPTCRGWEEYSEGIRCHRRAVTVDGYCEVHDPSRVT